VTHVGTHGRAPGCYFLFRASRLGWRFRTPALPISNERQARPLTQLEAPEARVEAWEMGTKKPPEGVFI